MKRHDGLKVGDPCPYTGKPYDGYSWSNAKPYDTCRACCEQGDPMAGGVAASLDRLAKARGQA